MPRFSGRAVRFLAPRHPSIVSLLLLVLTLFACKKGRQDDNDDQPGKRDETPSAKPQDDAKTGCGGLVVSSCDCPGGSLGSMSCEGDSWGPCDCSDAGIVQPNDPHALASDGLPLVIPAPSSPPPTLEEWNALTQQVTVKDSSALKCESYMLREWLRVSCYENGFGAPTSVSFDTAPRVQAYKKVVLGKRTSLVVQVVRGRPFSAQFGWSDPSDPILRTLVVDWPSDADRPSLRFETGSEGQRRRRPRRSSSRTAR